MLPLFIRVLHSTVCFSLVLVTIFASIPLFLGLHIMSIRESSWMDKRWKSVSIVGMLVVKSGIVRKKQRYKCPESRCTMCEQDSRIRYTDKEREAAIILYLEGDGFRRIARILTQIYGKLFHNQTIIKWVKKAARFQITKITSQWI